ncbi:hypothetical protein PMAYCL1PPCAC_30570, partial [Pristionchus mayeri]
CPHPSFSYFLSDSFIFFEVFSALMDGILDILPILIPPIPLTEADRKEFSEAEHVVKLWPSKQERYFKNPKSKKRATSGTYNLRIQTLLKNTSRAAKNTLHQGLELGMWPESTREVSPEANENSVKISPCPVTDRTEDNIPRRKETEEDKKTRLERRRAEMVEYDRRMAEREAQEDKEEKDRERRIEAHRMSQIRADQLKSMIYPKTRLLRPDRDGIRLKWERRAVKC